MSVSVAVMLALVACKPQDQEVQSPGVMVDDLGEGVASAVFGSIGETPGRALVLHVNAAGAAVPGTAGSLMVDGVATTVSFDGLGYGEISLDRTGSALIEGGVEDAWVHAVSAPWEGFGMLRAEVARTPATHAMPAHKGFLAASATEVWWVGPGEIAHRVLAPDAPIGGIRTAHVDLDGILDAIVWAGDTVYLLKGRANGGLGYGAAIRAEGYAAVGADVGDLDGNDRPDVVIAWDGQDGDDHVQTLLGDGLFTFESRPPRVLASPPEVIAIGDNTGEGANQVTVIREGGEWSRYVWGADHNLIETGPTLAGAFPQTAWMDGGHDINNDGGDDLAFLGPLLPDQPRDLRIYDLVGTNPQVLPLQPPEGYIGFAEANGNGVDDLMMSYADGEGVVVSNDGTGWVQKTMGTLGDHGPIAATDLTQDGVPEVFVAGDSWRMWDGGVVQDDDGSTRFVIDPPGLGTTGLPANSPFAGVEVDANPSTSEIVGFTVGLQTRVVVWQVNGGNTMEIRSVTLPGGAVPGVDIAVCGTVAWALTTTDVHRIDLAAGTRTAGQAMVGTKVACGAGPSSAEAAVLQVDAVTLLGADAATVGTSAEPGGKDVALVDVGAGPEVATCTTDGCTALAWPFSTTEMAFVYNDAAGLHAERASGDTVLPIDGEPSLGDVDGDGIIDLMSVKTDGATSTIGVWRGTGQFWGPAEVFHAPVPLGAIGALGDVDGDGVRDAWATTTGGAIVVSGPR